MRDCAWRCLWEFGIDRLPVDLLQITRRAGIRVVRNSAVNVLLPREKGKSFFDGSVWVIVYDDRLPTAIARFTLAHELGHIFLGHETTAVKYERYNEFERSAKSEEQADQFALRLLCPACVLWGLGLHTAEEIADFCHVDYSVAAKRSARMKQLYNKQRFLTLPIEKQIYERFDPFIQDCLRNDAHPPQNNLNK